MTLNLTTFCICLMSYVYAECRIFLLLCWMLFCWVSLCWVSLCWVSLCWVSLCWVSLCWVSLAPTKQLEKKIIFPQKILYECTISFQDNLTDLILLYKLPWLLPFRETATTPNHCRININVVAVAPQTGSHANTRSTPSTGSWPVSWSPSPSSSFRPSRAQCYKTL